MGVIAETAEEVASRNSFGSSNMNLGDNFQPLALASKKSRFSYARPSITLAL